MSTAASNNLIFVYGSLLSDCHGKPHPLLSDSDYWGKAVMAGRLFEISGYPGAVADSDRLVHGEVYRLRHPESTLHMLDDYEECSSSFPEPHEYQRISACIAMIDGQRIKAWVYRYNQPVTGLFLIQSGDYRQFLTDHG